MLHITMQFPTITERWQHTVPVGEVMQNWTHQTFLTFRNLTDFNILETRM
jgi:hypothetical protein